MVGDDTDRSATTTLASRAISLARVSAVRVMLSLEAVPRIVTLRAASPASRKFAASCSISVISVSVGSIGGSGFAALNAGSGMTAAADVDARIDADAAINTDSARGA